MAKNNNLSDFLTDIANAIREKKGTSGTIPAQEFSDEILSIQGGSGGSSGGGGSGGSDNEIVADGLGLFEVVIEDGMVIGQAEVPFNKSNITSSSVLLFEFIVARYAGDMAIMSGGTFTLNEYGDAHMSFMINDAEETLEGDTGIVDLHDLDDVILIVFMGMESPTSDQLEIRRCKITRIG